MADTKQHYPPGWHPVNGIPEEERDWHSIDRLIVLMSLVVTRRLLLRRGKRMPDKVRTLVIDRMGKLIEFYKRPRR